MRRILWAMLIASTLLANSQRVSLIAMPQEVAAGRKVVPGTKVSLIPPAGFEPSDSFTGFEDRRNNARIVVLQIPMPFEELMKGFSEEAFSERGMTLHRKEAVKIGEREGVLLFLTLEREGVRFGQWMAYFGTESLTVNVVAGFPEANGAEFSEKLRQSILSARLEAAEPDPLANLSFTFDAPSKLKLVSRMANALTYTKDGTMTKLEPSEPSGPLLIIAEEGSGREEAGVSVPELCAGAAGTWGTKFKNLVFESPKLTDADGYPVCEITGTATDPRSKLPLSLMVFLVFPPGRTYSFLAQVETQQKQEYWEDFRKVGKSLRPGAHRQTLQELNARFVELYEQGKYAEAVPVAQEALHQAEVILGAEHPDVATLVSNLAVLYQKQGRYSEAESLYQRALSIQEKTQGPEHPDVAGTLNGLGFLYKDQGKYAQAEPLYKRALSIREKALGPEHPDVAVSLNNLAELERSQGKFADAVLLYQRALQILEKVLGPEHPNVGTLLNNLAVLYRDQGKPAEAEPLLVRAVAISEKARGSEHPEVAASLNNLAGSYEEQGKYAEAEPLYQRALQIVEKALGPEHPYVATTLSNLAGLYDKQGKCGEAGPIYQRALGISEKVLGPDHPDVATALNNLGVLYDHQGKYETAEPLLQRSLRIREKALGPEHPGVAMSLEGLGVLYYHQGKYADAEPLLRRALRIQEKALGPEHPGVVHTLNYLSGLYEKEGKRAEADPLRERALRIQKINPSAQYLEVPCR